MDEVVEYAPAGELLPLDQIGEQINAEHSAALEDAKSAVQHAIACGQYLIDAKAHPDMKHGQWLPWLEANFAGTDRTARNYMRLADPENRKRISDMPTVREALEHLAESKAPSVHHSSKTAEHYTPDHILEHVCVVLAGIDLDPCADPDCSTPAAQHFTEDDDGLAQDWRGTVYMNPPYGKAIDAWCEKLMAEWATGNVHEAIALVPARTDTAWFARFREHEVCFVRGRLTFKGNNDPAPFPSALVYVGQDSKRFRDEFSAIGDIWRRV